MNSIFKSIDASCNSGQTNFWISADIASLEDIEANQILSTELSIKSNDIVKTKKFVLTKSRIYYLKNESPKFMSVVCWKQVEPFVETDSGCEKYGFRLICGKTMQDFYTTCSETLERWLSALAKVCIMCDLEDDYAIIKEVGKGSYATVYLAQDLENFKDYAVKTIAKSSIERSSRGVESIITEISIMRELDHSSLGKLYKVYENEESVHLVMDYVPGGELFRRVLKRAKFTEESAAKLIKNLLEGLKYMHSKGITHRDVKPENVLMASTENDFEIKIIDFGMACYNTDEGQVQKCGSPGYVAPEILKNQVYGEKVDLFSAGIILYVLLSGKSPFTGSNHGEILAKNRECRFFFPEKYWGSISEEGLELVLRLTDSDPQIRPSAEEALRHRWFLVHHIPRSPASLKVSPNAKIQPASPLKGPSSELMQRVLKKNKSPSRVSLVPNKLSVPSNTTKPGSATNVMKKLRELDA